MNKPRFHIILFEPEIPPNTGNIIRLCANVGCDLHLVHPLGFSLQDKYLKRAGLDYHEHVKWYEYANFDELAQTIPLQKIYAIETCGTRFYHEAQFQFGDALLFGPETRGLPSQILEYLPYDHILKIPMEMNIRSINLSNSVAIVTYEAWRQNQFLSG